MGLLPKRDQHGEDACAEGDVISSSAEKSAGEDRVERDAEAGAQAPARVEIDPEIERRVRRKLDLHLIPLVSGLYLLAFLDRSNIG